jgi:hypothetical protein
VLPVGFLVFGVGAFVSASYGLGWIPPSQGVDVFTLLLAFVVPVQAVGAIFAFLSRDSAGGTTLAIFGATWSAIAITGRSLQPGQTSTALGYFLLADGVVIVILGVAALFGNPTFSLILSVACARFALNGVYEVTGSTTVEHVSGYVGLVLCAVAGYAGLAFLLEDGKQEPVLPMLRHGPAKDAFDADLAEHLERLESEPGVRTRL